MDKRFSAALGKVRENIASGKLLNRGDRVLCALSGGADSASLLIFLKELRSELGIEVCAAHFNHGIRGEEADRDEKYCRELCEKLGIRIKTGRADVPMLAKERGESLETCARELRYGFLFESARELGCNKIATAHHAYDNIETVLLHMIRGCGLGGLTGIAPERDGVIRPMLTLRKEELVDALDSAGVAYVHDSTNDETDHARNYIRHKILPHIYALNESADKAFYRMCVSLAEDNGFINGEAERVAENADRKALAALHEAVLTRYVALRYEKLMGKGKRPDNRAVKLITEAIRSKGTVRYDVTGGVTAYISDSGLQFMKSGDNVSDEYCVPLNYGENIISPIGYRILITTDKKVADEWKNIYKLSTLWCVKSDKITDSGNLRLFVRNRRTGDRYVFGKLERDVRRQLINFKIPVQKRAMLPCICTDDGIIGVCGLPLADNAKATRGENCTYLLYTEE